MKIYKKLVVVLVGLPLVGKTTMGEELSKQSNLIFLDVEKARKRIEGSGVWLGPEREKQIILDAYELNHSWAKDYLITGVPVVLAATYSREIYHKMLIDLSKTANSALRVFHLVCPEPTIFERIRQRHDNSPSNIRTPEQFYSVRDRYQLIKDVSMKEIDSSLPIEVCIDAVFRDLKDFEV